MIRPASLAALAQFAVESGDPYLAVPVYPVAEGTTLEALERVILAKPRHRLKFAAMKFVSSRLLTRLSEEPSAQVALRLAVNPATPPEVLKRLRDRWPNDARVAGALVGREARPGRTARPASRPLTDRTLARRSGLPPEIAARLSNAPDSWVRRWLARNPTVPAEILGRLAGDLDFQVRRSVGRNPACPAHLVAGLARDAVPWVRAAIAFRDDLPPEIIDMLAEDNDMDVLSGLGRNPGSPPELLARIASSADEDVRRSVILNRAAPADVLEALLDDPYPLNRALLVIHANLPEAAAWRLIDDSEPEVRYRAMARAVKTMKSAKPEKDLRIDR